MNNQSAQFRRLHGFGHEHATFLLSPLSHFVGGCGAHNHTGNDLLRKRGKAVANFMNHLRANYVISQVVVGND